MPPAEPLTTWASATLAGDIHFCHRFSQCKCFNQSLFSVVEAWSTAKCTRLFFQAQTCLVFPLVCAPLPCFVSALQGATSARTKLIKEMRGISNGFYSTEQLSVSGRRPSKVLNIGIKYLQRGINVSATQVQDCVPSGDNPLFLHSRHDMIGPWWHQASASRGFPQGGAGLN